jgi:O-antigen/teichoic acid export membrane protein
LALLAASFWLMPVFQGGIQGLEFFSWLSIVSVLSGLLKIALVILFLFLGFGIAGCLGAFLVSGLAIPILYSVPLKRFLSFKEKGEGVDFRAIIIFLAPVAVSSLCFSVLTNFDMVMVRYFFSTGDSGFYSLAQMVGKIFLFLPGAISIVMFPRTSGLNARNLDTLSTLRRSLIYFSCLSVLTLIFYNLFPSFCLRILTGKTFPETVSLGRVFAISMSCFSLLFILISYFLSIKDMRFIKYLIGFLFLQLLLICVFHKTIFQVQAVICLNAVLLLLIHLKLAFKKIIR